MVENACWHMQAKPMILQPNHIYAFDTDASNVHTRAVFIQMVDGREYAGKTLSLANDYEIQVLTKPS